MSTLNPWGSQPQPAPPIPAEAGPADSPADDSRWQRVEYGLNHVRDPLDHLQANLVPTALLRELNEQVSGFQEDISAQTALNHQLQEDLAEARRDQVALLLTPGMKQLIALFTQLSDASQRDYGPAGARQTSATEEFEHALELTRSAIEAFGFAEVPAEPGTPFDGKLHYAAERHPAEEPGKDQTIKSLVRPGFIYANAKKAAFPARVVVYKYDKK